MPAAKTISVIVPTYNCSDKIKNCLESIKWATEIIIVDMGSTDNTLSICRKYQAKIYRNIPPDGNFDRNRKLGMKIARSDWLLKLDSDEVLSLNLQNEIQEFLNGDDDGKINGFNFYNRVFMFGKQIKHGFVKPHSHELRMVRKGKWHYNPYRFHQQITVDGKVASFINSYDHFNYKNISEFFKKTNVYTELDSEIAAKNTQISVKQIIASPLKSFLKLYLLQLGFLDKFTGFIVCFLYAIYNLIEKIKVFEKSG